MDGQRIYLAATTPMHLPARVCGGAPGLPVSASPYPAPSLNYGRVQAAEAYGKAWWRHRRPNERELSSARPPNCSTVGATSDFWQPNGIRPDGWHLLGGSTSRVGSEHGASEFQRVSYPPWKLAYVGKKLASADSLVFIQSFRIRALQD